MYINLNKSSKGLEAEKDEKEKGLTSERSNMFSIVFVSSGCCNKIP
jgi:hypothetical protein